MRFLQIKIKDFLAIGDVTLDFTEGTRLLLGKNLDSLAADDNGAGKSSIGEALRWCLYGETVRSAIDKSLDVQHVIRKGTKKAVVTLVMEIDDVPIIVTRTRTKTKSTFDIEHANVFHYEGKAAEQALEAMFPLDVVQFSNLVHLDGSYPKLFAPSTDRDRKEILADLVDIAITQQMQEEATNRLTPLIATADSLRQQMSFKKNDIEMKKQQQEQAEAAGKEHAKRVKAYRDKVTTYQKEQEALEEKELTLQTELQDLDAATVSRLEELKKKYNSLIEQNAQKTQELEVATDSFLISELEESKEKLNWTRTQRDIHRSKIEEMEELQRLGKCPTCGQDTTVVGEEDILLLVSKAEGLENELKEYRDVIKSFEEKRKVRIERIRKDRHELDLRGNEVAEQIQSLVGAKERKEVSDKLTEVRKELKEVEKQVVFFQRSVQNERTLLTRAKQDYLDLKKVIKRMQVELHTAETQLIDTDRAVDRLSFWKKGFGPKGVPSLFIETVLPQISNRIQKYADILTGGDVIVTLKAYSETKAKTVKEAIQISAVNTKGASIYGANSTGERNRIDLAVTLGLIDYFKDAGVFESNLMICDEIFDGLDATGVEHALMALDAAHIPSVIVVSHHEHLKPLFPSTMYIQKKNGVSELVA